jgi:lipopolysaccharide transport system permease protein
MELYQKESVFHLLNPWRIASRLYGNRELLRQFTARNIQMEHKGSALGMLWSVLSPLLLFGAYTFVFVVVFQGRYGVVENESRVDYAIAMFLSLALIQLFLETITVTPLLIAQNANYVKKVVFPLEILPAASVGAALFRCCVSICLVLVAAAIWGPGLALTALWLVPIVIATVLLAAGAAWMLAALGVFLRDLAPFIQFTSILLMFMSAVFYSLNSIPANFGFLRLNPLVVIVETGRAAVVWHAIPARSDMIYIGVVGVMMFSIGNAVFNQLKTAFPDVL